MQTLVVPGSIVVGVDGSEHAERAVVWAARQALLEQRPLLVLHSSYHATLRDTAWLDAEGIDHVELRRTLDAAAYATVEQAVIRAGLTAPGVDVDAMVVTVDARGALVDASEHAQLVVVGSHGRGPVGSVVLGSVSASVARHARCPVVVCRPTSAPVIHTGIVVGVDGSEASHQVLEFAFRQASLRGLPLQVVPCFWDVTPPTGPGSDGPPSESAAHERSLLSESVAGLRKKFADVQVQLQLHRGLVDECLLGSPPAAQLLVIGRYEGPGRTRFLHASGAIAVLEHADSTVAVVPESDALGPAPRFHHEEGNTP